jgi:ubiquinone/menaquinone biosynthesis C-methylase UbiE
MSKRTKQEQRNTTHYVPDWHSKANLASLTQMDHCITFFLGGVLPEQADPTVFHRVLDIGCGSGNWLIEAALMYPTLSLVGADIDPYLVKYVAERAEAAQIDGRVEVYAMDALKRLEFSDTSFDLVNLRFAASFLRIWDWSTIFKEIVRVTRPQGTIRLVEMETLNQCSSAALNQLGRHLTNAFYSANHFFTPQPTGVIAHLEPLLRLQGFQQIQTKLTTATVHRETEEGQKMLELTHWQFTKLRPFIQKWTGLGGKEYDGLCQQALADIQQDQAFCMQMRFFTIWGRKGEPAAKMQAF